MTAQNALHTDADQQAQDAVTGCWKAVAALLEQEGVQAAFGLPADDLDLLEALDGTGIRFLLCRDQRNALFMATGYALQSGATGIAFTGKGPAVTNTLTGLLEAKYAAAPVVLLSAGTAVERRGAAAFQEVDQLSVVAPLVKWAARVDAPARLAPMLRRALLVAREGVPGPVYLELPDHLLTAGIPLSASSRGTAPAEGIADRLARPVHVRLAEESAALRTLKGAERPVLLIGGGMRHHNGPRILEGLAERLGAAVFCTASGRGAFDETHPQFCGLAGLYLPDASKRLWERTDCLLTLGSRLEETATYGWPSGVGQEVPVVQVNVDAAEFHTDYAGPKVLADAAALLPGLLADGTGRPSAASSDWTQDVRAVHEELHRAHREELDRLTVEDELHIAEVLAALAEVLPDDLVLVQENGLQDMWSYQYPVHAGTPRSGSIVPSEQTSLGFGAAAAAGVKTASPQRPVVAFVGDGAFNLFAVDLPTLVEQQLGVLYVVLRNGGYGWLQSQLEQRKNPLSGFRFVDSGAIGQSAPELPGLYQLTLGDKDSLRSDIEQAWKICRSGGPVVLNVPVRMADSLFGTAPAGGDFPLLPAPGATKGNA
ncbi:thiamine pyrophosphate-binding protein [Streptomyces violascens]|uniref:thiamine pyrophosphate-binding protein n=1 Tax=Streptomyces violascens TaxID=67381 RepID=UPI0036947C82